MGFCLLLPILGLLWNAYGHLLELMCAGEVAPLKPSVMKGRGASVVTRKLPLAAVSLVTHLIRAFPPAGFLPRVSVLGLS